MRRKFLWIAVIGVLLVGVSLPIEAQQSATIRGVVSDPTGSPAAGAKVTAINVATGLSVDTTTNSVGAYAVPALPIGTYILNVEAAGFRSVLVQNVVLNVNDNRELDVQLELGEIADEVTVTESSMKRHHCDTSNGILRNRASRFSVPSGNTAMGSPGRVRLTTNSAVPSPPAATMGLCPSSMACWASRMPSPGASVTVMS